MDLIGMHLLFVLHVGEVASRERKGFGVLLCEEQSHVHGWENL